MAFTIARIIRSLVAKSIRKDAIAASLSQQCLNRLLLSTT